MVKITGKIELTNIIDISLLIQSEMPIWPGSVGFRIMPSMRIVAGDNANVSRFESDLHVGTHIDAPWHFLDGGHTVEKLSLESLVGLSTVAYLPEAKTITPNVLSRLSLSSSCRRLLLRTKNSDLWASGVTEFRKDYVALTADGARWVVNRGIHLIGVDYLSVQRYSDNPITHQILLRAGIVILEGLNLAGVVPGVYELICLPLRIAKAEAAPARAVLRRLPNTSDKGKTKK